MLTILVLFVGLTLATAVIAYWSDNLGKKLGKKRVSLWGMRPRTTATFLTIASSWLIMIFTLGVMLAIFPPLRQALLKFDKVKADVSTLSASKTRLDGQVGVLNQQLATLTSQTTSLEAQVKKAAGKLKLVSEELKKSGEAVKSARREQKSAEKEAYDARKSAAAFSKREQVAVKREQDARKNLKIVEGQRDVTKQERLAAQQELKVALVELQGASAKVKVADKRVQVANDRVTVARDKVTLAEKQVKLAQFRFSAAQLDLDKALTSEQAAKTNAEKARQSAKDSKVAAEQAVKRAYDANQRTYDASKKLLEEEQKVREAQNTVEELEKQGEDLRRANELALTVNQSIANETDYILASDIRVPVGRTLVARTFEQGVSFTEATEELRALFGCAADKIVPGFLPGARLQLASRPVPLPKVNDSDPDVFVIIKDDEIYINLAEAISRSQTPLSVRLVAERNHLDGEKTLNARFIIVPIRPALPDGAELASATFNQNISDAQLFSALLKLVEAGREVAKQNGVTPPLSPEAPDFYAPGSNEQIFEALRKVSALDDRARVRILTDQAISTSDQLSVRFEVTPLASATAQSAARKSPA